MSVAAGRLSFRSHPGRKGAVLHPAFPPINPTSYPSLTCPKLGDQKRKWSVKRKVQQRTKNLMFLEVRFKLSINEIVK